MKNITSFILVLISFSAFAQNHFVRFNNAGYKTNGIKTLIINADESLYSKVWSISINDSIVLKGQIKKSITGKGDHTNFPFNYKVDFSSIKFIAWENILIGGKEIKASECSVGTSFSTLSL